MSFKMLTFYEAKATQETSEKRKKNSADNKFM